MSDQDLIQLIRSGEYLEHKFVLFNKKKLVGFTGILPLQGKIMNVTKSPISESQRQSRVNESIDKLVREATLEILKEMNTKDVADIIFSLTRELTKGEIERLMIS